jgi:hypothetical protein
VSPSKPRPSLTRFACRLSDIRSADLVVVIGDHPVEERARSSSLDPRGTANGVD